jgi:membrane-bound lytic murein transglycosylase MltF
MCDSAHNGGYGGLTQERRMCAAVDGCDPDVWFGNVELHSTKSRVKWKGYGESAYSINRGHVRNVMIVRRPKYAQWFGEA